MSFDLVNLWFEDSSLKSINLKSTERYLLLVLCYRADNDHVVYCSIDYLCEATNLSEKTIKVAMKSLRDKKILVYTNYFRGKKNNIPMYWINLIRPEMWR